MDDLQYQIKKKFANLSTEQLIKRMEKAPDFGYDDEEIELNRRLKEKGKHYRWKGYSNPKIEIYDE